MKLLELRKNSKLSQDETSKKLGILRATYANYEAGKTQPDIETLCQIADYYGVSLDYLCDHKTKAVELPPNLSDDDKQAIFAYIALPELKRAVIRGEIKAIAIV